MASRTVPVNGYYVYILYREDGTTPFYVGKGGRDRLNMHERMAHKGNTYKDRIILQMLKNGCQQIPKRKVAENLTDAEAKLLEIKLIKQIGRYPDGPLANLTDGGDGVCGLSEDRRLKRNISIKNAHADPEYRKQRREIARNFGKDPEYRKKVSEGVKRHYGQEGQKQRNSDARKKAWNNHREVFVAARQIAAKAESTQAKKAEAMKKRWEDPVYREKFLRRFSVENMAKYAETLKRRVITAEEHEARSAAGRKGAKARWSANTERQTTFNFE